MKKIILFATVLVVLGVMAVLFVVTSTSDKAVVGDSEHSLAVAKACFGANPSCCALWGYCQDEGSCEECEGHWLPNSPQ